MQTVGFLVLALGVLAFGLVSGRAQRSILTPPMAFVAFGFLVSQHGFGWIHFSLDEAWIHLLAELTLVVILFTDASRIDLGLLRREHDLPVRLLTVGLPLTILAGTALGAILFPELSVWEAALLAAILAPTDAALGQAVVSSKQVPVRIRQALNVESGLNDGIALPVVLILFSVACATEQAEGVAYWVRFAALQVGLGPIVGVVVGYLGGKLIERSSASGWMSPVFQNLATLAIAILAFSAAELVHGNGFIAAFCAGLILGNTSRAICTAYEFAEAEGQLLTLGIFTVFGAVMAPEALAHFHGPALGWVLLYAALSLTLVRMLPVLVSLLRARLRPATVLFLGWFGPRGIASILFALLVVEGPGAAAHEELVPIVMVTVLLSVFTHGITAFPGAQWYARHTETMRDDPEAVEHQPVTEMPVRLPG